MNEPFDRSKLPPEFHLLGMLGQGVSGYIEGTEAMGQIELVLSDTLPVEIEYDESDSDYEALGIIFGSIIDTDPIFRYASLPEGWSKRGTEHSMWSQVVDETGKKRVAIFYKAAFYDRRARMRIVKG